MRERTPAFADPRQPERESPSPADLFWEEMAALVDAKLDPELLQEASEYLRQQVGPTYWDKVRREAEAFWERRYDPDASEELVLVRQVMDEEWGDWLKGAITLLAEKETPGTESKQIILEHWGRLTPDEQAAMMVEQLRDVLGSEQGKSLRRELGLEDEPPPES